MKNIFKGVKISDGGIVVGNLVRMNNGLFIIPEKEYATFIEPEYHYSGMGCNLEDRNIQDRYEAMSYGWESCLDKVMSECLPEWFEIEEGSEQMLLFKNYKIEIFNNDILQHEYYKDCKVRAYFDEELLAICGTVFDDSGDYEKITLIKSDFEKRISLT